MKVKTLSTALAVLVLAVGLAGQDRANEMKLQQAIDLLEAKGDTARAIPLLDEASRSKDDAVAARALLYLGQAQEGAGKEQARRTYERILQQFANQLQIAAQARSRLTALSSGNLAKSGDSGLAHRVVSTLRQEAIPYGPITSDGRYLLFAVRNGTQLELRDLLAGTDRVLLSEPDVRWQHAVLSRDGRQLAWTTFDQAINGYALWIGSVTPTGVASPRLIYKGEKLDWLEPMDWSVDGRYIAAGANPAPGGDEILLISITGESRRLGSVGNEIFPSNLSFSPDGRFLAADPALRGARDVVLYPLVGDSELPVVVHRADDALVGWSPDGMSVLFSSDRTGTLDLWAQNVDAGKPLGPSRLLKSDIGRMQHLGVAADGSIYTIAAFSPLAVTEVQSGVFDFRTGKWNEPLSDVVKEYFVGQTSSPAWSPDGTMLAYLTFRFAGQRRDPAIAVRSVGAGLIRELRPPITSMLTLTWAPGGKALLVAGDGNDNRRGWWTVDPATGEAKLLAPQGDEPRPTTAAGPTIGSKLYLRHTIEGTMRVLEYDCVSYEKREIFRAPAGQRDQSGPDPVVNRDGTKLIYRRVVDDGSKAPFRRVAFIERDLRSGAERTIATGQFGGIVLSPDGRYIATGSNDASTKERALVLVDIETGESKKYWGVRLPDDLASGKVTSNAQNNPLSVNAWAPDSQSVLVNTRPVANKPGELWWVPAGDGAPGRVLSNWEPSTVRVHPDGSRVVVQIGTRQEPGSREVWRLENVVRVSGASRK